MIPNVLYHCQNRDSTTEFNAFKLGELFHAVSLVQLLQKWYRAFRNCEYMKLINLFVYVLFSLHVVFTEFMLKQAGECIQLCENPQLDVGREFYRREWSLQQFYC